MDSARVCGLCVAELQPTVVPCRLVCAVFPPQWSESSGGQRLVERINEQLLDAARRPVPFRPVEVAVWRRLLSSRS